MEERVPASATLVASCVGIRAARVLPVASERDRHPFPSFPVEFTSTASTLSASVRFSSGFRAGRVARIRLDGLRRTHADIEMLRSPRVGQWISGSSSPFLESIL